MSGNGEQLPRLRLVKRADDDSPTPRAGTPAPTNDVPHPQTGAKLDRNAPTLRVKTGPDGEIIRPQGGLPYTEAPQTPPQPGGQTPAPAPVMETPSVRLRVRRGPTGVQAADVVSSQTPPPEPPKPAIAVPATQAQLGPSEVLLPPSTMLNDQFHVVLKSLKPGTSWQNYRISRPLGVGLTGATCIAFCTERKQPVLLKFLDLPADDQTCQRFHEVATRLRNFNHDSVCKVLDHVWQPPYAILVSELMRIPNGLAPDLNIYCDQYVGEDGLVPERAVLKVGFQIASGLAAAHEAGLYHGDLKPENILFEYVTSEDGSWRLRMQVTDLGPVQILGEEGYRQKMSGVFGGADNTDQAAIDTGAFLAPEQWQGAPVSMITDQFAASALIHFFLTLKWAAKRPRPSTWRPGINESWDPILCKALRTDPARRFESTADFADCLNVIDLPAQ